MVQVKSKKAYVSVIKFGFYLVSQPGLIFGAICYLNTLNNPRITSSSSGPFTTIAKSLPQERGGFENLFFQSLKNNIGKLSFEAGNSVGVVFKSFFEGVIWDKKSHVDSAAKMLDKKYFEHSNSSNIDKKYK